MYTSNADNEGNRKMDNAKTAADFMDLYEAVEAMNWIGHGYHLEAKKIENAKRNRVHYRVMQWNSAHDSASARQQVLPVRRAVPVGMGQTEATFTTMRELHNQIQAFIAGGGSNNAT